MRSTKYSDNNIKRITVTLLEHEFYRILADWVRHFSTYKNGQEWYYGPQKHEIVFNFATPQIASAWYRSLYRSERPSNKRALADVPLVIDHYDEVGEYIDQKEKEAEDKYREEHGDEDDDPNY